MDAQTAVDWLELHSENFFDPQSPQRFQLNSIAEHYPLSFHGVGLSLGSSDPLNTRHLQALKDLIEEYNPSLVSEHLSWSSNKGRYFNDLLPIPYTVESLAHFSDRVDQVQNYLGRQILIENPTAYLSFDSSTIHESEFLGKVHERTGCGLLLDLNNIYVNSINLGLDASEYLTNIPVEAVQEIHLAGFTRKQLDTGEILIDTHGSRVSEPVWQLFKEYRQICRAPALIEWDTDIPELDVLLEEAQRAENEQSEVLSRRVVA
ncbi:hypothetical protein BGP75_25415 [Motiliproteus sp. MSK22-1]|nr:hypothetical protein BGP75_25415 [Motiliproteus sp. MSK22-1]